MSEHKSIFKSASVISGFTVVSRITGFVRDVLMANVFGTGVAAQAFFVAFKIPNMLRDILGEGAGNAAFVPVFCEVLAKKTKIEFLRLVNSLLVLLLTISGGIAVMGVLAAPLIVRLMAPGFLSDPAKFTLAVQLTQILFPYLVLVTVSAYFMSVANSLKSFAVPASSSVAYNLVLILLLFFILRMPGPQQIFALGFSVLLAGCAQVLIQGPSLLKSGIDFKKGGFYAHPLREAFVRKIGRLISPRILGTSIYQLNIFVDTIFASLAFLVGEGAIAAIYYANRIIQFPFSVFGVALSNAALPSLSASSTKENFAEFKAILLFCLKAIILALVPLSVGILLLARPLVEIIFQRGSFGVYSTVITSRAVFFYTFGLLSYASVRILSLACYALQDTMTPVKTSAVALGSNILLNFLFIFVFKWQIAGLALASSLSATLNFYLLHKFLKNKIGNVFDVASKRMVAKTVMASFVMALVIGFGAGRLFVSGPGWGGLMLVTALGAVTYAVMLRLFRVCEFEDLVSWLRKKR
ncbi:MAG: murein biosynthesis integral membrane protein MurJ [Candidatus Omnitrophota bacterium]